MVDSVTGFNTLGGLVDELKGDEVGLCCKPTSFWQSRWYLTYNDHGWRAERVGVIKRIFRRICCCFMISSHKIHVDFFIKDQMLNVEQRNKVSYLMQKFTVRSVGSTGPSSYDKEPIFLSKPKVPPLLHMDGGCCEMKTADDRLVLVDDDTLELVGDGCIAWQGKAGSRVRSCGNYLVSLDGEAVVVRDVKSTKMVRIPVGEITDFYVDGNELYVEQSKGLVSVFDLVILQQKYVLLVSSDSEIKFQKGKRLESYRDDAGVGHIEVINVDNGQSLGILDVDLGSQYIIEKNRLVFRGADKKVKIVDITSGELVADIDIGADGDFSFDIHGRHLVITKKIEEESSVAASFNLSTKELIQMNLPAHSDCFICGGNVVRLSGSSVEVSNLSRGVMSRMTPEHSVKFCRYYDKQEVIMMDETGKILIWNIYTNRCSRELFQIADHEMVRRMEVCGRKLVCCYADETVRVFDLNTGRESLTLPAGGDEAVESIEVSGDLVVAQWSSGKVWIF